MQNLPRQFSLAQAIGARESTPRSRPRLPRLLRLWGEGSAWLHPSEEALLIRSFGVRILGRRVGGRHGL